MAIGKVTKNQAKNKLSFHQQLVLNQFMFHFFKGESLHALKARLGDDRFEGVHDDGQTHFFHEISNNFFNDDLVDIDDLRRYDLNIVSYWQQITEQRNRKEDTVMNMKYFQYMSLLFTEIYLDWYFNKKQQLLDGLNEELLNYCEEQKPVDHFKSYILEDLNKLAYWNATGSGKTLLMHINILQYLHYYQNGNRHVYPDKIILLTPNERLSDQHLTELLDSGFSHVRLFEKSGTNPFKGTIEIIDINKLADDMGDKTVAVEAFEGNNLVLIDEGHKGTGTAAGAWMKRRDAIACTGFAFEYSATFGQAVSSGKTAEAVELDIQKKKSKMLFGTMALAKLDDEQKAKVALDEFELRNARIQATREVYAKSVLFDYSYKFFYEDGYGKESLILNLDDDKNELRRYEYFTACLLSFYQQQYLYTSHQERLTEFNIENPLWVFVGSSVAKEDSDIQQVVKFLAWFLSNEPQVKAWIKDLIKNNSRILDNKGRNVFDKRFLPLGDTGKNEIQIYQNIMERLFNTSHTGQRLSVVNLKGSKGEMALRVGISEPFGLINVGDSSKLYQALDDEPSFDYSTDDFAKSLFNTINNKGSKINILIGSRKFTEGWSSWRVSTMGLLNIGKGEGSQIIQLFGRGVRLKGQGYSLKRSSPAERPKGLHLEKLETLNVFGVRADYMATFKQYLEKEGVTPSDEILELDFETRPSLPKSKLKTLKLKEGYKSNQEKGFNRVHFPSPYEVPKEFKGKIKEPHVKLDLFPKIEALSTTETNDKTPAHDRQPRKIKSEVIAAFNFERIYIEILDLKLKKGWSNLRLDKERLKQFCLGNTTTGNSWYTLLIPEQELEINLYSDVQKQEDIMISLLQRYTDRFYRALKNAYEGQFFEVAHVHENDPGMLKVYHFEIEDTEDGYSYSTRLKQLQELVNSGQLGKAKDWDAPGMVAITFDKHLYYPLMSIEHKASVPLKMRPTAFDAPSEVQFVRDLEGFLSTPKGQSVIGDKSIYLLRNADTKAKGLGFALAENFYPDFLLWLVDDETGEQWLSLIDPKGIRQIDLNSGKFGLYKEIKKYKQKNLNLSAFILSATAYKDLVNVSSSKDDLEKSNVVFMEDGKDIYLEKIIDGVFAG